jgi:hypothetical protein
MVLGEADDSPGLQLIGVVLTVCAVRWASGPPGTAGRTYDHRLVTSESSW